VSDDRELLFREVQRPRMWWGWLAIAPLPLATGWAFVQQVLLDRPWGSNPAPDWLVVVLFLVFGLGMPAFLLLWLRLVTEVTAREVRVRLVPVNVGWVTFWAGEIERAEARRYRPIREYLGWGIRWGPSGRAYNLNGDRGVQLVLASGRRVLIGSERADELEAAIAEAMRLGPVTRRTRADVALRLQVCVIVSDAPSERRASGCVRLAQLAR
jgi:hypothetical protein